MTFTFIYSSYRAALLSLVHPGLSIVLRARRSLIIHIFSAFSVLNRSKNKKERKCIVKNGRGLNLKENLN